nr:unnamed protein product [Callosobruchus analis]
MGRKINECTNCTFETVQSSRLKEHIKVKYHDIAGNITNRCIYCNKTFTRKQALDDHLIKTHPEGAFQKYFISYFEDT